MRITHVSAVNVKAPSFQHELGAVNVIVGNNFSFKTAILEAIRLGLLGFVPGLPRTNQGIFSLSSGPSMSVQLRLSDGRKIEREFVRKGAAINRTDCVPPAFKVPDVLLDAGEYLRLSERERVKYV